MKKSILLILLFSFLNCRSQQNEGRNLILNPGFETSKGDEPDGWVKMLSKDLKNVRLGICTEEVHSGKASIEISRNWCNQGQQAGIQTATFIPVVYGKKYLLDFWYKTKGIEEYPLALISQFKVKSDSTATITYRKNIPNSDSWKHYYILLDNIPRDSRQIEISFYTPVRTKGSIWLDDIVFAEASGEEVAFFERWRRQPAPSIRSKNTGNGFAVSGYYRVEKDDNRWWYVDPRGNAAWAVATVGSSPNVPPEKQDKWFRKTYGTTKEEINQKTYEILSEECGFNAFSGWTSKALADISEARFNKRLPYMSMTHVLNLSDAGTTDVYAKDRTGRSLNKSGHWVVDPYNPVWRELARQKAEKVIPDYKDKPWFAGWYVDNEMDFNDLFRFIWADYSSREFIRMLNSKYGHIGNLNKTWSSGFATYHYNSFEDILSDKPEPLDWDDPAWNDFVAFERQMMAEYIDFTYTLVKGLDPSHLVISNRIHLGAMPHIYRTIDLWGKYDIVCMNIYPDNNLIGFNPGEIEIMRKLHDGTGRPVIIGEWSVPALDSKLYEFGKDPFNRPLDWSFPQVLHDQKERGEAYGFCVRQLASLDFIIGSGWFKTTDVDTPERRANRGIMNGRAELYKELTSAMKKANNAVKREMGLVWENE